MGSVQEGLSWWVFPHRVEGEKLLEFMNLLHGRISVKEYSCNFTQLSKYAPTFVANSRERMNKFVMGVSSLVEEECRTAMLHHGMDICRLMLYAQQIEETKLRKMNRDGKRARKNEPSQPTSKKMFLK